jgi:hypothetical protein
VTTARSPHSDHGDAGAMHRSVSHHGGAGAVFLFLTSSVIRTVARMGKLKKGKCIVIHEKQIFFKNYFAKIYVGMKILHF